MQSGRDSRIPKVGCLAIGDAWVTEERSWVWSQSEHSDWAITPASMRGYGIESKLQWKSCRRACIRLASSPDINER
ncbi:MAG TPA: hypothetical protein DEF79_12165 [Gammaproteobacteria bacterium]|nr:hypothetical protein [Gammaproteobacteria bacterium]